MGMGAAISARRHNENDVTVAIAGLWRYGGWNRGHRLHRSGEQVLYNLTVIKNTKY